MAGDCEITVPGDCVLETCWVIAPTSSFALVSVDSAAVWDWPTTSGTPTDAGPLETNTVTWLPTWTSVPAEGLVLMTWPLATVELAWGLVVGTKPAARSFASACEEVSPSTFTSPSLAGPLETTMPTCEPSSATDPAPGAWLITRPLGTVVLGASDGRGSSPAARSTAPAACSVSPVTFGTLTDLVCCVSTSASATAPASNTAPAPHISARRRRRRRSSSEGAAPFSASSWSSPPVGASSSEPVAACGGGDDSGW